MKRLLYLLIIVFLGSHTAESQVINDQVSKCAMSAGPGVTYLKDFRIQLGSGDKEAGLRYKGIFPMSKNMKYKFTLCTAEKSVGLLIMNITDNSGRKLLSSYDPQSGKTFQSVEFQCNKTGTYNINFDFMNHSSGSGIGIISLVR